MSVHRTMPGNPALVAICILFLGLLTPVFAQEMKALTPEEDFKQTMDAYRAEKDPEAQANLWFAFLKRNPDGDYSAGTINYLVSNYFVDLKKDPLAGIEFVKTAMSAMKDAGHKAAARGAMIQLYGTAGDMAGLNQLLAESRQAGQLTLQEYGSFATAAVKAEAWEMVRDLCTEAEPLLTPEFVRAQNPERQLSEQQVASQLRNARADLYSYFGQALVKLGDPAGAVSKFAEAGKNTMFNYAGVAYGELAMNWAEALLANKDYAGAMARIAPDALIYGGEKERALYKRAWLAAGNDEAGFAAHVTTARMEYAKAMPEFTAFDYDGKPVSFTGVKGKVTLLAFWFPT